MRSGDRAGTIMDIRELWNAYQLGQVSCDHTDYEVFCEVIAPLLAALESIATNTCCGPCQEAALVAQVALDQTRQVLPQESDNFTQDECRNAVRDAGREPKCPEVATISGGIPRLCEKDKGHGGRCAPAEERQEACQCIRCRADGPHDSDCAVHNGPAHDLGPCNCSLRDDVEHMESLCTCLLDSTNPVLHKPNCGFREYVFADAEREKT